MSKAAPRQIPLDLPWPRHDRASRDDFIVSESNIEAIGLIDNWRQWAEGRLALVGPEGAGKTHLALIWATDAQAEFVDARKLAAADIHRVAESGAVVLEDCDRRLSGGDSERALFHLINTMRERDGRLLLTARTPPARWNIALPDVASRLAATTIAIVQKPDDALLRRLVTKLFADRDILVDERVTAYITSHIDRNFAAAQAAVAALDAEALETARPITMKMARTLFGW